MNPQLVYLLGSVALLLSVLGSLTLTVLQLPGNWLIVGCAAFAAWLQPDGQRFDIEWLTVGIVMALALAGEVIELAAGGLAAQKHGASRRAVMLSLVGGIVGSLAGGSIGSVVPVLGTLIGVVAGGSAGAFTGAYIGEAWKGRHDEHAIAVGKAVAIGRLFGTLGKVLVGVAMALVVACDAVL